jgi:hypothetical protein
MRKMRKTGEAWRFGAEFGKKNFIISFSYVSQPT